MFIYEPGNPKMKKKWLYYRIKDKPIKTRRMDFYVNKYGLYTSSDMKLSDWLKISYDDYKNKTYGKGYQKKIAT